jgi:RNA polymerase sigma-70 factor, ECF subfamily
VARGADGCSRHLSLDLAERTATTDRDRRLVLAYLGGENDAFAVIVEEYSRSLAARAERLLDSRTQAEDACQETFRRALEGIARFGLTGEYRLGAWLNTILRHVCADQLARRSREQALGRAIDAQLEDEPDIADQVADPHLSKALRHAMTELSPSLRRALVLRDMRGLPYAQLAALEHISEENARARVHRAHKFIQDRLAQPLDPRLLGDRSRAA